MSFMPVMPMFFRPNSISSCHKGAIGGVQGIPQWFQHLLWCLGTGGSNPTSHPPPIYLAKKKKKKIVVEGEVLCSIPFECELY